MTEELKGRVSALRRLLTKNKLDGILIQDRTSSLYISGFNCSNSTILITRREAVFFTDFRYKESAGSAIKHLEVRIIPQRAILEVAEVCKKLRIKTLGFEESTPFRDWQTLGNVLGAGVELKGAGALVSSLRQVKSPSEIRQIAANQRLNETVFNLAVESVRIGQTEIDIHEAILHAMVDHHCAEAFGSIIATGKNSALPHAVPSKARIGKGQFLLFDMGVKQKHYHSDMTRTVAVGEKLPTEAMEIYEVVRQAQQASLDMLGPGVPCKAIDSAARDIITDAGYGDYFGHGLGHGVGLEIHEGPTLNARSTDILKPGMVVTVEPGIYLPKLGGVRIEDLVVITETGYKNFTRIPKNMRFIEG